MDLVNFGRTQDRWINGSRDDSSVEVLHSIGKIFSLVLNHFTSVLTTQSFSLTL